MPLTPEQAAALKTLTSADPKEFAEALQTEAQPLYQGIFKAGHAEAAKETGAAVKAKEKELAAAQKAVAEKDAELAALREKTPDVEAVRKQYEERLTAKDREAQEKVAAAEQRVQDLHKGRFKAELRAALIAANIDPDYAGEVLVSKHDGRIQVGADGAVKVLDEDGLTPISAPDGKLAEVFAGRIAKTVDPKWVRSGADGGGGSAGQSGTGGGSSYYDGLRKSARETVGAGKLSDKAAGRLGLTAAAAD